MTDSIKSQPWTYVRAPVEYEVLPYLLSERKCTDIGEWDWISFAYRSSYTVIREQDLNCRRYFPEVLRHTYERTYTTRTTLWAEAGYFGWGKVAPNIKETESSVPVASVWGLEFRHPIMSMLWGHGDQSKIKSKINTQPMTVIVTDKSFETGIMTGEAK